MPKQTVPATPAPDENGWIKGTPIAEGSYWYCTKDNKYNEWRIYLGSTFVFRGALGHDLTGYGTARPDELKNCFYQPALIPHPPVATQKKTRATKTASTA